MNKCNSQQTNTAVLTDSESLKSPFHNTKMYSRMHTHTLNPEQCVCVCLVCGSPNMAVFMNMGQNTSHIPGNPSFPSSATWDAGDRLLRPAGPHSSLYPCFPFFLTHFLPQHTLLVCFMSLSFFRPLSFRHHRFLRDFRFWGCWSLTWGICCTAVTSLFAYFGPLAIFIVRFSADLEWNFRTDERAKGRQD